MAQPRRYLLRVRALWRNLVVPAFSQLVVANQLYPKAGDTGIPDI